VLIEQDEDGLYVATVPSLKGCHSQARDLETVLRRIREAALLCLEVQGEPPPHVFVGVHHVDLTR